MHFEFLIEDQSGAKAMETLIPKLLGDIVTYKIHSYKGIGHIPKGLRPKHDAKKRIFLDQLPKLLRGYGKSGYIIIRVYNKFWGRQNHKSLIQEKVQNYAIGMKFYSNDAI